MRELKISTKVSEFMIDTGTAYPMAQRQFLEEAVESLRQQGIIFPCMTEWSSPVVIVPKKDGRLRLCVDRRDHYPLPHIDDILYSFKDSTVFSIIDLCIRKRS